MDADVMGTEPRSGQVVEDRPDTTPAEGDLSFLATRLSELEQRVPPPQIADVWLFPPLPDMESSAEFLLFTRFLENDARALYSARMVPANGTPAHQIVVEHGTAPADRVPKLVQGLQKRLGQVGDARHIEIAGDHERWRAFIDDTRETDRAGDGAAD